MPTTVKFYLAPVPSLPALYAMEDFSGTCAYVGISKGLRCRLNQHFLRRDISVTTGVSAACLNL